MPFFKTNNLIIYFAHVPKCGGSSIEDGLANEGISISFLDRKYWGSGLRQWCNSSPQHIQTKDLEKLLDVSIFDHKFAIIRDPVSRFLSALNHNRQTGRISAYESIESFLKKIEKRADYFGYRMDNHFVPASNMVPDGSRIFYLENGLEEVSNWLNEVTNGVVSPKFGHSNPLDWNKIKASNFLSMTAKKMFQKRIPSIDSLSPSLTNRIKNLYACDYDRFF